MIANLLISTHHRRRADDLAAALDGQPAPDRETAADVAVAHMLIDAGTRMDDMPAPDFTIALRSTLVAHANSINRTRRAATPAKRPPLPARPRQSWTAGPRVRFAMGAFAIAIAISGGVSLASENAVPGDRLYGYKRTAEDAHLAVSGSGAGRGELLLDLASTRLDEALDLNRNGGRPVHQVLAEMRRTTLEGVRLLATVAVDTGDPAGLTQITGFTANQRTTVSHLMPTVEGVDLLATTEYLGLLDVIDLRAAALRAALPCGSSGEDELGPKPGRCAVTPDGRLLSTTDPDDPGTEPAPFPPVVPPVQGGSAPTAEPATGESSQVTVPKPIVPKTKEDPATEPVEPEPSPEPTEEEGGLGGLVEDILDGILGGGDGAPAQ